MESLYLRGKNQPVAINFYDIPGIALKNEVRKEEIAMLINGEIKPNTEVLVNFFFTFIFVALYMFTM